MQIAGPSVETYFAIKPFAMSALLIVAFGYFFIRIRRIFRLMRAVTGKTQIRIDKITERIKVLFTDVLAQSNVRRKPLIGMGHTLIFIGFLAIQPHSLELMISGIFPGFGFEHLAPHLYGVYLFSTDILAFLVLFGFGYAIYRRLLARPRYLTMGMDANLIILFTCLIVVTFHFLNAFQILLPPAPDGFNYRACLPVSSRLIPLFGLDSLHAGEIVTGYETSYWIHILTILGFLVYIPGSKHLHLLAAAPNVFLKRLDRPKAIVKTDIMDETAETFGLGKISELSWKDVLNLYACTECGRCEELCPASNTGKPLSPKNLVHDYKIDLFDHGEAVLSGNHENIPPIIRDGSPVTGDVLWSCTTCRACEDICPVNIDHLDLIFETRKHRTLMESDFPPEMQETFTNLENQLNPWGFTNDTRADWCKGMDVPLMMDNPNAELLYFVGCAGSFDDRGKKIAQAMARVLKKAGVDFAILGPEEACNGDMARRAGNEYIAQMLIQQNVDVLNQYKPRKILTGCPHCFNIIKNEYPRFGARFEVVHHTEYLFDLHKQGRLIPSGKTFGELTFHDSCYLGRWNNIYQTPRDLLVSMNAGGRLIEMARSGAKGFCCGAGGGRMFMEETLGNRINIERSEEVVKTGAGTVAVACPFCTTMLRDGILETKVDVKVRDIVEIVDEAVA